LTSPPYLRNIARMIYRQLKRLAMVIWLMGGLTGCTQLFGSSDANADDPPPAKAAGHHSSLSSTKGYHSSVFSRITEGSPFQLGALEGEGDFWQHLRNDFQMAPADDKPQVRAQINWFMHNREYLDHTLRRSEPYMYYILQQIEKRNLPGELALLPVGESAYNPAATSSAGAVGMWQLMRATARDLGVKQNFWFDGRRDIYASTNAALDQLTYLQSFFGGDWMLALAAYDSGEGTVQSAIRRSHSTNFWSLPLPSETRSYVPRLLALASIVRDPGRYNITLPPISDKPYLAQVDIGAPISLARAAQLAGLSLAQIKQLNPGYSRMMTDPNGPYKLILPIDRIALFKEQLSNVATLPKITWGRYKIQRGDNWNSIARRFHTTVNELLETNHLNKHHVPVGRVIMIQTGTTEVAAPQLNQTTATTDSTQQGENTASADPVTDQSATDTAAADDVAVADEPAAKPASQRQVHIIRKNETLVSIAKRYKVKTKDLLRWNKLKANKPLKPGSKLVIWTKAPHASSPAKKIKLTKKVVAHNNTKQTQVKIRPDHYVVRAGDNVSAIAKRLGVKSANLMKWNHLAANTQLKPGQRLIVH
jgi:membrane-bound lytic murein transglycosylase D